MNLKIVISILMFIFCIINPISAFTLHLNSLVFLIYGIRYHLTEVLEQPGGGFPALNVMEIRDRRHANVCKQRTLQADVGVAPP